MARNNEGQESNSKEITPAKAKLLANQLGLCSTVSSYTPSSVRWDLTESNICDIIERISRGMLRDITDVTIEVDRNNSKLTAYVWLPSDSDNLVDKSDRDNNYVIRHDDLIRVSESLKNYMKIYGIGREGKPPVLVPDESGKRKGINVDILKFINVEFDKDGRNWDKDYGVRPPRCGITITAVFNKANRDDNKCGSFRMLQVEKYVIGNRNLNKPVPKKSWKAI